LTEAKEGLEHFELTKNRLEWIDGKNEIRLLNDAYNASPTSVKAALSYFSNIQTDGGKIAVLGDILELGEHSKELHESIAEAVDLDKYKAVLLYGDEIEALYHILRERENGEHISHFIGDKEPLVDEIEKLAKSGDLVLFKSSNGTDLLSVVDQLRAETKE
jgi:UDP-N-acetylmuramyl pentapeptide synthase